MRHLANQHEMGINPGTAILQSGAKPVRPPDVLSPDGGCQTIARIVGPPQNLIFIIKDGYTDHRAEDLALHDGIFLFCVCQQRRSEIVTFTFRLTSASNHTDMAEGLRLLYSRCDALQVRQRT